jgi:hypothetical protein
MTLNDVHRRDAEKEYDCSNLKQLMTQGVSNMIPGIDFVLFFFYFKQGFSLRPLRLCGEQGLIDQPCKYC